MPIKFRAWDKVQKKMLYFDELFKGESLIPSAGMYGYGSCEDLVVMQHIYTKDKKGLYVYEGDIIELKYKIDYGICEPAYHTIKRIVVVENIKDFFVKYAEHFMSGSAYKKITVLGNKFEHPELLKVLS